MKMAKSKIWMILLLASVAVNVALVGFVGTQWYRHAKHPDRGSELTFDRRAAFSTLEKEEKQDVRQVWKDNREDFKGEIDAFRQAKRKLADLLAADTLDQEALNNAFEEVAAARYTVEKRLFIVLNQSAAVLPPEQRKEFFWRGFKRWSERHHEGPPPPRD